MTSETILKYSFADYLRENNNTMRMIASGDA